MWRARLKAAFFVRQAVWYMSAERISWFICFPLMLWFSQHQRWFAFSVCIASSMLVLTFRQTIGNIRTVARIRAQRLRQQIQDQEAQDYVRDLASGRPTKRKPLILFLRPFSGDRAIQAKDPTSPDNYDSLLLETRIATAFFGEFTTIAFSNRIEGPGIWGDAFASMPPDVTPYHPDFHKYEGRLFYLQPGEVVASEENWFDTFRLLARSAKLIVSVPLDVFQGPEQSSTVLELFDLKINNMLERCVFVMPPEQSAFLMRPLDETESNRGTGRAWSPREFKVSALWESTRLKLIKGGVEIPAFRDTPNGATLFALRGRECRMIVADIGELGEPNRYFGLLEEDGTHAFGR